MVEHVKKMAEELLQSGKILGFLGLKREHGQVGPHLFQIPDELEDLTLGDASTPGESRYPLNKILLRIHAHAPSDCFGILVRGCDQRGLRKLFSFNQLNPDKVVCIGIVCPQELADACECLQPYPDEWVKIEKEEKAGEEKGEQILPESVAYLDKMELQERFIWWMDHFSRCIKCYGCRDICPMCFCRECSLQNSDLIQSGQIPPEYPIFHLVRAVHMADRCIDCGLCTQACPAGIPLRTLYKKVVGIANPDPKVAYHTGGNRWTTEQY